MVHGILIHATQQGLYANTEELERTPGHLCLGGTTYPKEADESLRPTKL